MATSLPPFTTLVRGSPPFVNTASSMAYRAMKWVMYRQLRIDGWSRFPWLNISRGLSAFGVPFNCRMRPHRGAPQIGRPLILVFHLRHMQASVCFESHERTALDSSRMRKVFGPQYW